METITQHELQTIWQMVMIRFPKLEIEQRCRTEYEFRHRARESYKQKLINELSTKKNISQTS
jgi:hypothetical protein